MADDANRFGRNRFSADELVALNNAIGLLEEALFNGDGPDPDALWAWFDNSVEEIRVAAWDLRMMLSPEDHERLKRMYR